MLSSYAYFRSIFDEVAAEYPDVEKDYAYIDTMTAFQVQRPQRYDVLVAENMFGDIISDLAASTVGGLGLSGSGDVGHKHGLFQSSARLRARHCRQGHRQPRRRHPLRGDHA